MSAPVRTLDGVEIIPGMKLYYFECAAQGFQCSTWNIVHAPIRECYQVAK